MRSLRAARRREFNSRPQLAVLLDQALDIAPHILRHLEQAQEWLIPWWHDAHDHAASARVDDPDDPVPVREVRSRFDRRVKAASGGRMRAAIHPPGEKECYFLAAVAAPS